MGRKGHTHTETQTQTQRHTDTFTRAMDTTTRACVFVTCQRLAAAVAAEDSVPSQSHRLSTAEGDGLPPSTGTDGDNGRLWPKRSKSGQAVVHRASVSTDAAGPTVHLRVVPALPAASRCKWHELSSSSPAVVAEAARGRPMVSSDTAVGVARDDATTACAPADEPRPLARVFIFRRPRRCRCLSKWWRKAAALAKSRFSSGRSSCVAGSGRSC